MRFFALGNPAEFIFDEIYYAKDAKAIIDGKLQSNKPGYEWEPGAEVSWPHPEYGKLAIALGILAFGNEAFGWRFVPALAGFALLLFVFPLARRFGLSPGWSLAALLLAAADQLGLAQSRVATLDIFVALWTVVCVYCALRYVQDGHRRRWLLLAGLSGGLALGTKWSGALALLVAAVIVLLFRVRRPEDHGRARLLRAARAALPPLAALVVLPLALYVLSYAFYFSAGHSWADWWEMQRQAWYFNFHLHATHSYASAAPTWILDVRPVWYYFDGKAVYHGIVAMGNPILWWGATLALVLLPVIAINDRDRRLVLPALVVALLYFPWFAASRTSFLYYMTPVAPFMAVLVATGLSRLAGDPLRLPRRRPWRPLELQVESGLRGRIPAFVFVAVAAVTALWWYQIGHAAAWLFWRLPAEIVSRGFAYVITTAAIAAGCGILTWATVRLRHPLLWRSAGWAYVGLTAGIWVAYLPIVVNIGIEPQHYYRLIWLGTWI